MSVVNRYIRIRPARAIKKMSASRKLRCDEVWEERIRDLTPYKVTKEVMKNAGEKAIFLHCLPAFHDLKTKIGKEMGERFNLTDMEVTDEVFESSQSLVFDEAENRMHTIKAVMVATLGEPENR